MQTHKILLIALCIFLGITLVLQNKKPEPIIQNTATTTAIVAKTTSTTTIITKPAQQTFPKNITLSISNSYTFPDQSILTIKEINDSRCPTDVQYIWAGNVVIKLNIKKGVNDQDFELTYPANNNETSVHKYKEYNISVLNVQPNKGKESNKVELEDYRVIIKISK